MISVSFEAGDRLSLDIFRSSSAISACWRRKSSTVFGIFLVVFTFLVLFLGGQEFNRRFFILHSFQNERLQKACQLLFRFGRFSHVIEQGLRFATINNE